MNYSTNNGCLFYSGTTQHQNVCDPTLLFILGLESVSYHTLPCCTDELNTSCIHKSHLICNNDIVIRKSNYIELPIYQDICKYLQSLGHTNVYDDYVVHNCPYLKQLFNHLTGIGTNRTIPIILRNLGDQSVLDLHGTIYDDSNSTDYNNQYQFIINFINSAGYSKLESQLNLLVPRNNASNEELQYIKNYNSQLYAEHKLHCKYSQFYKYIDYKVMYSYALGVLYGCSCLGYDLSTIFHKNPNHWYNGELTNLVNSAWQLISLRKSHPITNIDSDENLYNKYKGFQINKLWNIDNTILKLRHDEQFCETVSIQNNVVISNSIIYSPSYCNYLGGYLDENNNWKCVDTSIISPITQRGIIYGDSITRYIANNEIVIHKAYKHNNVYLSPDNINNYFTDTASIGWFKFSESSYLRYTIEHPTLTAYKTQYSQIDNCLLKLAIDKQSNTKIAYYRCYLTDNSDKSIYGIIKNYTIQGGVIVVDDNNGLFDDILSDDLFNFKYSTELPMDNYKLQTYYNLTALINIYVNILDSTRMWNGDNSDEALIDDYGYTTSPSIEQNTYIDNNHLAKFDLRYNSNEQYGYWSSYTKHWTSTFSDNQVFLKSDNPITLYQGETSVADLFTYKRFVDSDTLTYYYNDYTLPRSDKLSHGFISDDELCSIGFTSYPCIFILTDDFGLSLLDENNEPLVWQDPKTLKYWNGLFGINQWQDNKPCKLVSSVYDTDTSEIISVYDDTFSNIVYINNTSMSYAEFYNHHNYGVIRSTILVFNDTMSDQPLDCYYDSYNNTYCIPNVTLWINKASLLNLGWHIVDGTTVLYNNDQATTIVYDTDLSD